ncbi:MAG TPA: HAMP domain-containing sensor histidine kinase [Kofleriaceae bacterium]|jgi:signal transduction histidine kinase
MVKSPSVSAARWMVGVMASVVLAFLLATAASQYVENAIASRAHDIIANAMPSVEKLSAARGHLHRLERLTERGAPPADLAEPRQDLEQALVSYAAVPFFHDERMLYEHVSENLAVLDRDRAAYATAPTPALLHQLRGDFALVDQALQRVVEYDATRGQQLGFQIERVRGQQKGIIMVLDGFCLALALFAGVLAFRQLRRAALARQVELREHDERTAVLSAQNEALGQFAGRVAHDVLSPLATAMLSLELVRQTCEADRVATRALERGVASVHRVHALVDGLLAFARAGGRPDAGDRTDLAPALADAIDGLAPQAQQCNATLALARVPAGAAACSPGVLTSIVTNLVSNALKYLGDAPVRRVAVRVVDAGERWHFEVRDTGPGIPAAQQQRIFEPYYQITRGGAGIGLGLATVDRLVHAHGGAVGVHSESGGGAMFWFELPKARDVKSASGLVSVA